MRVIESLYGTARCSGQAWNNVLRSWAAFLLMGGWHLKKRYTEVGSKDLQKVHEGSTLQGRRCAICRAMDMILEAVASIEMLRFNVRTVNQGSAS